MITDGTASVVFCNITDCESLSHTEVIIISISQINTSPCLVQYLSILLSCNSRILHWIIPFNRFLTDYKVTFESAFLHYTWIFTVFALNTLYNPSDFKHCLYFFALFTTF